MLIVTRQGRRGYGIHLVACRCSPDYGAELWGAVMRVCGKIINFSYISLF